MQKPNLPVLRISPQRNHKTFHPLLMKPKHKFFWQTLVGLNKKHGPVSAAVMKNTMPDHFHPQILADLVNAFVILKQGRRNGHTLYLADPNGRGVPVQEVAVTVEVFELEDGTLWCKSYINGHSKSRSPVKKLLKSRVVKLALPPAGVNEVAVVNDLEVD